MELRCLNFKALNHEPYYMTKSNHLSFNLTAVHNDLQSVSEPLSARKYRSHIETRSGEYTKQQIALKPDL